MKHAEEFTHYVQYADRSGDWHDGVLSYTLDEAKEIARIGAERIGRPTRIRLVPTAV